MKLSKLFADDRAVSPVVGVVILIAITVVLAAVVAGVVLGLGSNTDATPSASFEFTEDSGDLVVEHAGGDELDETNINISVNGALADGTNNNDVYSGSSAVTAGQTERLPNVGEGDTVRVIWQDPSSDKTAVLAEYEV